MHFPLSQQTTGGGENCYSRHAVDACTNTTGDLTVNA